MKHIKLLESFEDYSKETLEARSPEELGELLFDNNVLEQLELVQSIISLGAKLDVQDKWFRTPLHIASIRHSGEVVKALIDGGADVNADDFWRQKPLHCTTTYDNHDAAQILIDNGANIDARNQILNGYITPLHSAVAYGSGGVVKVLIDSGADLNIQSDYGKTPLHIAVGRKGRSLYIARMLIKAGASLDVQNEKGNTPWDSAHPNIKESLPELNPNA